MAKRSKPTNGKHKPATAVQRLAHKTQIRFAGMERVIAEGLSDVRHEIADLGVRLDRQGEFLKLIVENTSGREEQTSLLRRLVAQVELTGNLEPRVAKCEAEIEALKKKPGPDA